MRPIPSLRSARCIRSTDWIKFRKTLSIRPRPAEPALRRRKIAVGAVVPYYVPWQAFCLAKQTVFRYTARGWAVADFATVLANGIRLEVECLRRRRMI